MINDFMSSSAMTTIRRAGVRGSDLAASLVGDQRGGVASLIGLSIIPVALTLGLAIDGGLAYSAKNKLQGAIDAAALAAARAASTENADVRADARMFFDANYPDGFLGGELKSFDPRFDEESGEITIDAAFEIPTAFMQLAGLPTVTVAASTAAQQQLSGIELAMVLDVTGSMGDPDPSGGTKIQALKDASETLLNVIYGENETVKDVSISVVPYTTSVNLGADRTGVLTGFNAADFGADGWKGCVEARAEPFDQDDTPPSEEAFTALLWPEVVDDPRTRVFEPGFNPANDPNRFCLDNEVLPLTAEKSTVADHIDGLVARGGTLTSVGFNWGWRTISPRWQGEWGPDSDPVAYDHPTIGKAIIFMTDGRADLPRARDPFFYSAYGFLQDQRLGSSNDTGAEAEVNQRLLATCELAKREGIEVYTVMFALNNPVIEQNYRACASSEEHFFDAPNGEVLEAAFREIAGQLTSLRLTQ